MAQVILTADGETHLRSQNADKALCGEFLIETNVEENMLTCAHCAHAALTAIQGTTKKERKEWRDLA